MSRTTGYTCTAAANMVLDGTFTDPGLYPPELVGRKDSCFEHVIRYLAERQVHYHVKRELEVEHE
jgi:saccharopine dehydrogenase-like NADP-dependent oxidoreductase